MSQFAAAGKTQPPWARATVAPGPTLTQGPGPTATSALGASLLGAQATAHQHVAASAAAAGQTLTATGVHTSPSLAAAAAAVAAAQSQQAATANSAAAAAAAYGTSLTLGLTQNALQPGTVISQSGIAIPASLAPTAPVGTPGIALPTTLATTQVATVTYPAPRLIAQATQFQAPPPQHAVPQQPPPPQQLQQPIKQRFFTGTVTKLHDNFGFVDEDVFFQLGVVKGAMPKVGERVLVEASFNPSMPFKWNGTRIQVLPNQLNVQPQGNSRVALCSSMQVAVGGQPVITTAGIPPGLAQQVASGLGNLGNTSNSNQGQYGNVGSSSGGRMASMMPQRRHPSPPPPIRREREREVRREERRERYRSDREREYERERYSPPSRKRSRSPRRRSQSPPVRRRSQSPSARRRSSSPPRRRPRIVSRYTVQIPKVSLDMREGHVLELRKRYANLYIPSDFFHASIHWQEAFPPNHPFGLDHPCSFHIMHKDVDPVVDKELNAEPTDVDHLFSAKVMLMATPPLSEIYHKACSLAEDPEEMRENFVHPTRLISFLIGVKGKNETVAIGGPWSPSLDGPDPVSDPQVLIRTAIRTCKALTGIDLSNCSHWYRFAEIYYRRGESTHKGRTMPARVETVVLFLPDVWSCMPTQLEWDSLCLHYKKQLQQKMTHAEEGSEDTIQVDSRLERKRVSKEEEEEEAVEEEQVKNEPTHYSELDPKTMTVGDLRRELESRNLSSKGLKSQLIARLTKCLKTESDKENEKEAEEPATEGNADEEMKTEVDDGEDDKKPKESSVDISASAEDDKKVLDNKEKQLLTRRYNLPPTPSIVVHPSRTAKSGKFDCTVMSLSVLLDYRQEDNKEHSFEVSLFAELFNEMLMRDFGFMVYQALVDLEEKDDDKEKRKLDKKNDRKEKDDDRKKKDDGDEDTEKDDEETDEEKEEDEERKEKDKRRKSGKKEKNGQMFTFDPHLLLSFVYFDQNHCGYILEKDLEDIIFILGLHLSRAQVRRILQKVVRRDTFHYRKLTDKMQKSTESSESTDTAKRLSASLDELAAGNKKYLPVFKSVQSSNMVVKMENGGANDAGIDSKIEQPGSGLFLHQGAIVDIEKLMKQLERSEKARSLTEQKLKKLQEEVGCMTSTASDREQKIQRLTTEVEDHKQKLKVSEETLHKKQLQAESFSKALHVCQEQLQSLAKVVDKALSSASTTSEGQAKAKT